MSKPRLLVLTTTYPRWDNDVEPPFVHDLCRRLTDFEVHVVAPHARGAAHEEIMDGVHVHRFRYAPERFETLAFNGGIAANLKRSPWKYLLLQGFLLGMFFRALRVAKDHDIHLIHAHWMLPTGLIGAALRELLPGKNRLLVTAHGGDVLALRGKVFRSLRRWVSGEADAVAVVSHGLAEVARRESWPKSDHLSIAPMGVDLQRVFTPAKSKPVSKRLVFAGRLVEKKGVQHLVEAIPAIVRQVPDVHLEIAGDGPLRSVLEARVVALGIREQVTFSGQYALLDLPAILQRASFAVLPFDTASDGDEEGLGLTIIEMQGCGLPVVCGDVPAVRDVIEHGVNGLLVGAGTPALLADSVERLIQDQPFARQLAKQGRELALQRFDWSISSARYDRLLKSLSR